MEDIEGMIAALHQRAEEITQRRLQQVQEDEALLKAEISRLKLHSCRDSRDVAPSLAEIEEMKESLQKAREARDEYKFELNETKNQIKNLQEELDSLRQNQTKQNISFIADVSHNSERKSCAYTISVQSGRNSNMNDIISEENYNRELKYLHKTNQKYYEEIRQLKAQLVSQEALQERVNIYQGEINNLKKIGKENKEKMMHMQIEFDEKFKNCKLGHEAKISVLTDRIRELERVRDNLSIELGAAQAEIRSSQFSLKPEATELHNCIEIPVKAVTDSQQTPEETSQEKEELLNVNIRRQGRGHLQPIENIIEHEDHTFVRPSEQPLVYQQQATVVEVQELSHGVTRGTKRGQRGGQGSKKESPASQRQKAKKIKSSDEKTKDPVQNIKNELKDESPSTRKGARTRTVVNRMKKATDSSIDTSIASNKQNKKLRAKKETDENVEPSALEHSCPSLNATLEKMKPPEGTSTPVIKLLKKVQDDSRRANRRRNK